MTTEYHLLGKAEPIYAPIAWAVIYGLCTAVFIESIYRASRHTDPTDTARLFLAEALQNVKIQLVESQEEDISRGIPPRPVKELIAEMEMRPEETLPGDYERRMIGWPDILKRTLVDNHAQTLRELKAEFERLDV
jgi:hypothetical protein